jgi:hypothetical protein
MTKHIGKTEQFKAKRRFNRIERLFCDVNLNDGTGLCKQTERIKKVYSNSINQIQHSLTIKITLKISYCN